MRFWRMSSEEILSFVKLLTRITLTIVVLALCGLVILHGQVEQTDGR